MTAPTEDPARDTGRRKWQWLPSRPSTRGYLIVVGAGLLAVGYVVFAQLTGPEVPPPPPPPQQGLACPYIEAATEVLSNGDELLFHQDVDQAAAVANETLNRSGEIFGEPEGLAIELQYIVKTQGISSPNVAEVLDKARTACAALGRWPGP
jgi:hypothetical protein